MPRHKKFTFEMNESNATCPISLQVFLQPAYVEPCGHFFEMEEIQKWKQNNVSCPCCQNTIKNIHPASKDINAKLDKILENNPKLYDDCYLNVKILMSTLQNNNDPFLPRVLNILRYSERQMNVSFDEGISIFCHLAASQKGRRVLKENPKLCELVDVISLNNPSSKSAITPLYFLASSKTGRNIILSNPILRSKITKDGLNYILKDEAHKGLSPLYWLFKEKDGRRLLLKEPRLRNLIQPKTLHTLVQVKGDDQGKTASFWLKTTSEGQELMAVLSQKPSREAQGFFVCLKKILLCQDIGSEEKESGYMLPKK